MSWVTLVKDLFHKGHYIGFFEGHGIKIFYPHELRSLAELFNLNGRPILNMDCEVQGLADVLCLKALNLPPPLTMAGCFPDRPFSLARSFAFTSALVVTFSPVVYALPSGYQSVSGNVQFSSSDKTLNITTHAARAIANYQSFNIDKGETVNFDLPSTQASILNRVGGGDPSQIMGAMNANGQVFLVNPSGIIFGQTAQVNVGALHASTLSITDQDYLDGKNHFSRQVGVNPGKVVNEGSIQAAKGGYVILSGGAIENHGSISAPQGQIHLVVGDTITVNLDNDMAVEVTVDEALKQKFEGSAQAIENTGTLQADGGMIKLQAVLSKDLQQVAINNQGIIEAKGFEEHNGEIELGTNPESGAAVVNQGTVDVNGADAVTNGGDIHITATHIEQDGTLSATGNEGGHITLTSDTGQISGNSMTDASGTLQGGTIQVNTSSDNMIDGVLKARGGELGGHIEVHSGGELDVSGQMDASSGEGQGGMVSEIAGGKIMASSGHEVDVSGAEGGDIYIDSQGLFSSGHYSAHASQGKGGNISFQGATAFLTANVDASGNAGGGTITVGEDSAGERAGNFDVMISQGTQILANSTSNAGDGGNVVVRSEGTTHFYGDIDARPGLQTGNGGFVEISGEDLNLLEGHLQTGRDSRTGNVLLDPRNLYIQDSPLSGLAAIKLAYNVAGSATGGGFTLPANSFFGGGIAINRTGNILAIGADGTSSSKGAVYLFNVNTADITQAPTYRFMLGNGVSGLTLSNSDSFGRYLALNSTGDILVVGARGTSSVKGAAYIFNLNTADLTQTPNLRYTLANGSPGVTLNNGDGFASSVALNDVGNIMAVGVRGANGNKGMVDLFNLNTSDLTQAPTLRYQFGDGAPSVTLAAGDTFGYSIALNGTGNILAVGAAGTSSGKGAVYLFNLNASDLTQAPTFGFKMQNGNSGLVLANSDIFGGGVTFNSVGDIMAVGARGTSTSQGAIYLYTLNTADLTQTPTFKYKIGNGNSGLTLANGDFLGLEVGLNGSGNILATGAFGTNSQQGGAYLLNLNIADLTQMPTFGYKIQNGSPGLPLSANDHFGSSTALNATGNILAVGAYGTSTSKGAVYLFNLNVDDLTQAPTYRSKIINGTSGLVLVNGDSFGSSLSLNAAGNILAVGADGTSLSQGAAYLFGLNTANLTLAPTLGSELHTGTAGLTLSNSDLFGSGVALNAAGNILAVGADGTSSGKGSVYLFNPNPADVTQVPTYRYTMTDGSSGLSLSNSDSFGSGVSLNAVGDILAVGTFGTSSSKGAVYLFNLNPADLTQAPVNRYTLANGSPGLTLSNSDAFGRSTALNATGDILAVGADGSNSAQGVVDVFNLDTADLTQAPALAYQLASGSLGITLSNNDQFGHSVALNATGDILAAGASGDSKGGSNFGAAYLFNTGKSDYADASNSDLQITTGMLANLLAAGNNLTLQASNDIFVNSALAVNNLWGNGGNLILQAGRSILLNADLTTDNGNLTLIANDLLANGVVDSQRLSGTAVITMAGGTSINTGSGAVTIDLRAGTGKTYNNSGAITLQDVTAGSLTVTNNGITAGSNVNAQSAIQTTGAINLLSAVGAVSLATLTSSAGGAITLSAGTTIDDTTDNANNIRTTGDLSLTSNGAIGSANSHGLNAGVGHITVNSSGGNSVTLTQSGTMKITSISTGGGGAVSLTGRSVVVNGNILTTGNLTLNSTRGNITLKHSISGNTVHLNAAHAIVDNNGAATDIIATHGATLGAAAYIGTQANPLDVQISGGQLNTSAEGGLDNISIDINGSVSPNDRLILLANPSGLAIYNGLQIYPAVASVFGSPSDSVSSNSLESLTLGRDRMLNRTTENSLLECHLVKDLTPFITSTLSLKSKHQGAEQMLISPTYSPNFTAISGMHLEQKEAQIDIYPVNYGPNGSNGISTLQDLLFGS